MIYWLCLHWRLIARTAGQTNASDLPITNKYPHTPTENQSQNYHSLVFLQCMKCTCTRNTTNTPAEKLGSLGQAGVRAPKAFSRGVNPAATRLTSASSSAGLIAKADVVLLLEELRSTSSLPYCLCLQMGLELPAIVCGVCPLVPDWRMLDILPAALARWSRC